MITTDINFPDDLPAPLIEESKNQIEGTFTRTAMGSGRARQRRLFSLVPVSSTLSFIFNAGQARAFEAWYRDETNDGVEWFNIVKLTPLGNISVICRFSDENNPYSGPDPINPRLFKVTARVELYERPLVPIGFGELPDWLTHWSEFDVLMNYVWPEEIE